MTDADMLLKAILANPAEDTPRLAYADAIEESDPARAEFIRLHIQRDRRWPDFASVCEADRPDRYADADRLKTVESRLMELVMVAGIDHLTAAEPFWWSFSSHTINRGFIDSVTLSTADWLTHADALLAAHPVTAVSLTDVPPIEWIVGDDEVLPRGPAHGRVAGRERIHAVERYGAQPGTYSDLHDAWQSVAKEVLRAEWPGVKFDLPPPHEDPHGGFLVPREIAPAVLQMIAEADATGALTRRAGSPPG